MAIVEAHAVIVADSGVGAAGIPYVGPALFPIVEDFSGNAQTGIMLNMVAGDIVADVPGGTFDIRCLDFDGVDDHVNCGDVLAFDWSQPFSFSFWLKDTATIDWRPIVNKRWTGAPPFQGYAISETNGRIDIYIVSSDASEIQVGETIAGSGDGTWHHYVITSDGSGTTAGILFYRDGALRATSVLSAGPITGGSSVHTDPFLIGRNPTTGVYWLGELDEIAAYNRVLSAPEVATIYNSGVPLDLVGLLPPTLLAFWRLGEGTLVPWTQEIGENFAVTSGVAADSSMPSDLTALYALMASPTADSLCSGAVWMGLGAYSICGAEALFGADAGVNYAIDAGLVADSAESGDTGVAYAVDAGLFSDSSQTAWVFEELTVVAGCLADSLCSGNVTIGISVWSQMAGLSGFVCPGFDKTHHALPSPNPPAKTIPSGVRFVPPAPNPPNYGVGSGVAVTTPSVQTPIKQPTIVRRRQPT